MTAKGLYTQIESFFNNFRTVSQRKSIRYGLPFLIFMVGGSFGLKEWTQIRYQFSKVKGVSKEEAEKMGFHKDKDVTLESVYDEIKDIDTENWENKRGPRPWELNDQKT